jgi:hypothetical protein
MLINKYLPPVGYNQQSVIQTYDVNSSKTPGFITDAYKSGNNSQSVYGYDSVIISDEAITLAEELVRTEVAVPTYTQLLFLGTVL